MGTIYRDFLVLTRHHPATDLAVNCFNRANPFFSLVLFDGPTELTTTLSIIGPKRIGGTIYHLHCNIPQ